MIKVGSDFSGVGAFNQALNRLNIEYEEIFACDMDKYARQTFIENYGEPKYFPSNVYEREIPKEPLTIFMTSPPCQAFSLAGTRNGKTDPRGILFFNSLEFINKNKPRYFIFENVRGLLSDDNGKTFSEWVNLLGGKSVNGSPVLFPMEESVPYHLYWKVINAKDHGVPQNRERVFLVGIKNDSDNNFTWPKEEYLKKKLKQYLDPEVLTKYFLSEKAIAKCLRSQANKDLTIKEVNDVSKCLRAGYYKTPFDCQYIRIESNLEKYFLDEKAKNYVENTKYKADKPWDIHTKKFMSCLTAKGTVPCFYVKVESNLEKYYLSPKMIEYVSKSGTKDFISKPTLIDNQTEFARPITTAQDKRAGTTNYVDVSKLEFSNKRLNETLKEIKTLPLDYPKIIDSYNKSAHDHSNCITSRVNASAATQLWTGEKIRRLTPRECFRIMDFPEDFTWSCSDTQAYKMAGNSIVVRCLEKIINKLNLD